MALIIRKHSEASNPRRGCPVVQH